MPIQRIAGGGLISFAPTGLAIINFPLGRSKRNNMTMVATTTRSVVAGNLYRVDRAGSQVVPLDYEVHYELLLAPQATLYSVQTQLDVLFTAMVTSPVGVLTCFAVGDSTVHVSGTARLEKISETTNEPNFMIVDLQFFAEGGMLG